MKALRVIISLLVITFLWEVTCSLFGIPNYILPRPIEVLRELTKDITGLSRHFALTLAESAAGLIVAWLFAALFAFFVFTIPRVEQFTMPLIVGFKAVPLVALAPLFVLWFGNGFTSKVVMAATICFFPVVIGYLKGFRACTDDEVLFLRNLELSRTQELLLFRLMKATPFWLAGLRVASVLAVVGAIVAEFSGANSGLGYIVLVSSVRNDSALLMVGIILSALCGIILYAIAVFVELLILKRTHMEPIPE